MTDDFDLEFKRALGKRLYDELKWCAKSEGTELIITSKEAKKILSLARTAKE